MFPQSIDKYLEVIVIHKKRTMGPQVYKYKLRNTKLYHYQIQEFEFLFTTDRKYFKAAEKSTYGKLE